MEKDVCVHTDVSSWESDEELLESVHVSGCSNGDYDAFLLKGELERCAVTKSACGQASLINGRVY